MSARWQVGARWWPQWRSHWRVLHAWPLLAQCLLLSAVTVVMSLWLSWQVSGQAWMTWWQAQQREQEAWEQLQSLQQLRDQHQQRVHALQAMRHPSGQDWPAWVNHSRSPTQDNALALQLDWDGPLPSLLKAWQAYERVAPWVRVHAFVIRPSNSDAVNSSASQMHLELHTREELEHSLKRLATASSKQPLSSPLISEPPQPMASAHLFAAAGLLQGLPPLPPVAQSPRHLPSIALSQWQWVGALSTPDQSAALLAHEGVLYKLGPGQGLGEHGGEVVQVGRNQVWLRQWFVDSQGLWQQQTNPWPPKESP